ncbi:MAG: hypothetical protein R2932_11875 [Caldilineaceae bacterium]
MLDLGGNVRQNPKLSGTTHNIFGIQVGVAVTLLVKRGERTDAPKIFYARTDEYWRKGEKYDFLEQTETVQGIKWQEITPNARHTWLTSETEGEFYTGIPIGEKENGSLCVSRIWPRCCQFDCLPPDVNLAKYAPSSQRSLESI